MGGSNGLITLNITPKRIVMLWAGTCKKDTTVNATLIFMGKQIVWKIYDKNLFARVCTDDLRRQ